MGEGGLVDGDPRDRAAIGIADRDDRSGGKRLQPGKSVAMASSPSGLTMKSDFPLE